jgi:hypothetical protein
MPVPKAIPTASPAVAWSTMRLNISMPTTS